MSADARDDPAFNALPSGTRFGELEILGTLGVGGFGIVYLARDHALERDVAIKEYMPSQFATRDGQSHVSVRSMSQQETFELGRRSFVNEAWLLARFDHPSLLKVYRFWEANGTAYMAMPRLVGRNLREARRQQPVPPPEAWVRALFDAVLGALAVLHAQQVWHRDIAPDNIFLPADGGPAILLDFGAARQAIGDRTQVFTAILKPSFAPIEQYAEAATLRQGPWTDFYALAAVMHELLTGRPPPPATARAMGVELAPLQVPGYDRNFLAALDWALRTPPQQRPPSAAAWREAIEGRASIPPALAPAAPPADTAGGLDLEFPDTVQGPSTVLDSAEAPAPAATVVQPVVRPVDPPVDRAVVPSAAAKRRSAMPLYFGGGVAALLVLGLFLKSGRPPVSGPGEAGQTPPAAASQPAVAASPVVASPPTEAPSAAASAPSDAALPRPASAVAPSRAPAASVAAGPVRAAATNPALPASASPASRREPVRPIITEKAGEFRPVPRSPVFAAPEPVASAPAAAAPRPAAVEPAPAEPRSPAEACAGKMLLLRAWCVDRQCEKPAFQNDPECVKLREIRNSRNGAP